LNSAIFFIYFNIVRTLYILLVHYLIVTSIVCMYSNGGLQSFHGIHVDWSIWTGSYGIHMEWRWNPYGIHHSMSIPYGFHGAYGMRKWLGPQPKSFHMDSMEWTWIPYIRGKPQLSVVLGCQHCSGKHVDKSPQL